MKYSVISFIVSPVCHIQKPFTAVNIIKVLFGPKTMDVSGKKQ